MRGERDGLQMRIQDYHEQLNEALDEMRELKGEKDETP
jgi:hypothetical protein